MINLTNRLILIDAHVHIHKNYNLDIFIESVFNNFSKYADKIEKTKLWNGYLLLTEIEKVNIFETLSKQNSLGVNDQFKIHRTDENNSLTIISPKGNKIFIITGKQIIAENNIEILALCTDKDFEKFQPLATTVEKINSVNGIAVLPWGVGKWTGKRKEVLSNFLIEHKDKKFYLGDNSGRPNFWSEPDLFKLGNQTKHFVLPGTDALSIPSEINKTGSYGFYTYTEIDENKPTESVRNIISNLTEPPKYFGKLENPISFFKNQFIMQLNKRKS